MEEQGIKESKELAVAATHLTFVIIDLLKDGAQIGDAMALFEKIKNDPELKSKVDAAIADVSKVPAELKDLSAKEAVSLAMAVVTEVLVKMNV